MAGPIRQPIDLEALSRYVDREVPEIKTPIDVKQFGFGQSNPTYQLTAADGRRFVMRKKPPGKLVSKTAHQVEREYRVMHALGPTDVPVPRTYGLCTDASIVGTPFYIMEFLDGRIVEDAAFPGVSARDRTEMWHDAVRTLAKLHRVDPASVGLADFGKHNGFYDRQLKTLSTISMAQAAVEDADSKEPVGKIPHFDDMVRFFRDKAGQPVDRFSFVHGDFKIDNLVYHKTEPRIIGILDWEMSTIGHPLSDWANLINPFTLAASSAQGDKLIGQTNIDAFRPQNMLEGTPTRDQLTRWYAEAAGWNPGPEEAWGDAFGAFRGGVIMQGIKARLYARQASSAKAKEYADRVDPSSEHTWKLIELAKQKGKSQAKL